MRFKKDKKLTGLAKVANTHERGYDIIDNNINCGRIKDGRILLMINKKPSEITDNEPCTWKWIVLKKCFENNEEAKQWTKEHWKEIKELYPIISKST